MGLLLFLFSVWVQQVILGSAHDKLCGRASVSVDRELEVLEVCRRLSFTGRINCLSEPKHRAAMLSRCHCTHDLRPGSPTRGSYEARNDGWYMMPLGVPKAQIQIFLLRRRECACTLLHSWPELAACSKQTPERWDLTCVSLVLMLPQVVSAFSFFFVDARNPDTFKAHESCLLERPVRLSKRAAKPEARLLTIDDHCGRSAVLGDSCTRHCWTGRRHGTAKTCRLT